MPVRSVAIVGAGLAGLACARTLAAHGVASRLFDKGRAPGGRLATRRVELDGHAIGFDHGAQYLTARGALFRATLDAVDARPWIEGHRRVGVPRMSAIPRALADGLDLTLGREVVEIAGGPHAWVLRHATPRRPGGAPGADVTEDGPFEAVVVAVPAPQAAPLLAGPAPGLQAALAPVRMAPCWTLMAAFRAPLDLPDHIRPEAGPLAWAARDSSKPGRDPAIECWVVQAGAAWSRDHLEMAEQEARAALLAAFGRLAEQALPEAAHLAAHRWRHALVERPVGTPFLWDPVRGIGAAGDWCLGPRAEAATESGTALATAMTLG
jgi:predicted NAD/FAD-dependent oxidoreductase